jgi:hypothetical protein
MDLSFADMATVIANHQGEIEEKNTATPTPRLFTPGESRRAAPKEARKQAAPPEFFDADGRPHYHEIALFCQKGDKYLREEKERKFVSEMPGNTLWQTPTEKQAKWLFSISVRLGGKYDHKTAYVHW